MRKKIIQKNMKKSRHRKIKVAETHEKRQKHLKKLIRFLCFSHTLQQQNKYREPKENDRFPQEKEITNVNAPKKTTKTPLPKHDKTDIHSIEIGS